MAYQRGLTFRSPAQMAGGRATALCGQQSWPPPAPAVLLLGGQGHGAAPGAHISHHGVASRGSSSMPCWLEHRTRASVCYVLGSSFCTQRCRKMIRSRGRQQAMKRCTGWAQAGGTGSCTQDLGCQWSLGGVSATEGTTPCHPAPPGEWHRHLWTVVWGHGAGQGWLAATCTRCSPPSRPPCLLLLPDTSSNLEQNLLAVQAASVFACNRQTRRRSGIGTREQQ